MRCPVASIVVSLCVAGAGAQVDLRQLLTDPSRGWLPNTTISFHGEDAFIESTQRWSIANPPTYSAAIRPGGTIDVAKALWLASSYNISFLATAKRFGYTTALANLQGGLAIDLSQLNHIKINETEKTLTVGPGVSIDDILVPIEEKQFMMPIASSRCPSVIGTTLGGGVGRYAGLFGLMSDNLLSVRIITVDGLLYEASALDQPELFWAIRGAGANFGVVISATYRLTPRINLGEIMTFDFTVPASMSSAFFTALNDYTGKVPPELAGIVWINYNSTTNEPQILTNWVYVGGQMESLEALQPILELKPPHFTSLQAPFSKQINVTFPEFSEALCRNDGVRDVYSASMRTYNVSLMLDTFAKISDFYQKYPGGWGSVLQFELYPNQAVAAVKGDQTAWPLRDATGYFQAIMSWDGDTATADAAKALAKELRQDIGAFAGYGSVKVPVNYARGDEKLEDIYGQENLPQLANLKDSWDPRNSFRFYNPLPHKYP